MATYVTKVTRKGQMTIPIEFRRELGIDAGDSVAVEREGNKIVMRRTDTIVNRTYGALAKYAMSPSIDVEAEKDGFAQAVADEQTETNRRIRSGL